MNTAWHFPVMIFASFILFFWVIRIVLRAREFEAKFRIIVMLSFVCVVAGMLFGKYGATWGMPWWIYYPVPMLVNVLLPPLKLKMTVKKTALYLVLSFLSAPLIHFLFSFFLNWNEYMPFWKIPSLQSLML